MRTAATILSLLSLSLMTASGCGAAASGGEGPSSEKEPPEPTKRRAVPQTPETAASEGTGTSTEAEPEAAEAEEAPANAEDCRKKLDRLQKTPTHEQGPADYMEVASCFERAELPGVQLRLLSRVVRLFPASREAKRALRASGQTYEEIGFLDRAARAYEEYGRRYGRKAAPLLKRAICLQYILGDPDAEKNARLLQKLEKTRTSGGHEEPAELCPDALELVTGAICRLQDHGRAETDEMAESLAKQRAERFGRAYAAPAELCPEE